MIWITSFVTAALFKSSSSSVCRFWKTNPTLQSARHAADAALFSPSAKTQTLHSLNKDFDKPPEHGPAQKNRNKSNNPHLLQLTVNVLNDQIQSYKVFSTCKWNEFETQKEANLLNKVILLVSMQLKHNTYIVWPVQDQWLQYLAA